jgi:hypothetical protein
MFEDLAILRLNIHRYQRLLESEGAPAKRQQITELLHQALLHEAQAIGARLLDSQNNGSFALGSAAEDDPQSPPAMRNAGRERQAASQKALNSP